MSFHQFLFIEMSLYQTELVRQTFQHLAAACWDRIDCQRLDAELLTVHWVHVSIRKKIISSVYVDD